MNSQEKLVIYNLLKAASDNLNGYSSPDFQETAQDFATKTVSAREEPVISGNSSVIPGAVEKSSPSLKETSAAPKLTPAANGPKTQPAPLTPSLKALAEKIDACTRCQLSKTRTHVVPGTGCPTPYVLVIGEGPGYEEDMQGLPFVGPAGKLLDKMLSAIELSRNCNTYIANIVKCRPPMNRNPYPEEADACSSFLQTQIALLKPKMILCAGSVAAKNLLKTELGVTRLRGNFYEYAGIPVAVTYHPSALLRDESLKRPAWEDLKKFKLKLLEIAPDYQKSYISNQG